MSLIAIIAIVLGVVIVVSIIGGLIVVRRRREETSAQLLGRVAEADRALVAARAADRGWDPALLKEAAVAGLKRDRPDFAYNELHLVLVDDRPGTDQDRAELAAIGEHGTVRVVIARHGDSWVAQSIA